MSGEPEPFTLRVPDEAIADLGERLRLTRFPDQAPGEPWAYGTDVGWMRDLIAYWMDDFDWRAQEARLNAFPQYNRRVWIKRHNSTLIPIFFCQFLCT